VQIDGQYSLYQHNNDFGGPGAVKLRDVIAARSASNPNQFRLPDDNVTDGNGIQGTLTVGVSTEDGRGNITAYASYQDNKQILQRDRDYSACSLAANPTVSFACGGSGTSFPGQFTDFGANTLAHPGPDGIFGSDDDLAKTDVNPMPSYNFDIDQGTGQFRAFNNSLDQYNFGPVNHYLRPDTRYSLGAMGHYELAPFADVYTQLMFTDVRSIAQIAPGGAFFDTTTVNCDNPFLSAQQATAIGCGAPAQAAANFINPVTGLPEPLLGDPNRVPLYIGRRNVEGGGRQQDFHNTSFRVLVGSRGDIADGWSYDVSTQFSRTSATQRTLNYFHIARLQNALNVIADPRPGATFGQPVCASVVDGSDANCVPYNVFQLGGVTPDALNYVQAPGLQQGTIDQNVTQGEITGDLGTIGAKLPWAEESIKIAFGVENRRDKLTNTTDDLLTTAGLSGTGGPTISIAGSTNVNDLFMEASIPIVQGKAFAEQLQFDTAYRYSDYNSGIQTDTYKFGAEWAPVEDVRFRASYQRAVRAPNIVELFTAQGFNLFDLDGDPCGFDDPNPNATLAKCVATGMPAGSYGTETLDSPAGQYNFNQGGDTTLQPETSDTISYGIVFTPRFAPGLSVSLDYFDIDIEDLISTVGAENTLTACYDFNDQASCDRINRNPTNGALWVGSGNVDDLNTNIGGLSTKGVDLNLNYTGLDIGSWGSLSFNMTATYLDEIITDPGVTGFPPFDCKGEFAGACVSSLTTAVNPEMRTRTRIGWETPWNVDLALTHRYISSVTQNGAAANRIDRQLPHESYFDLFGSWAVTDMAQLRLGINNVLDNDPSINASVGTTGNGNTYPQVYDALGRYIFGGVTVKF
jgi:outer membrane receptor protein involved in Fe transport